MGKLRRINIEEATGTCYIKGKMICIEVKDPGAENKSSVFLKKDNVL